MADFSSWRQFEAWLERKGLFHIDFGLERVRAALAQTGLLSCPVIQVMGTNGKGSTCAFLASLAAAHGLKAGLYTSPHFISVKERILVNRRQIDEGLWLDCANQLKRLPLTADLTYFEFLTLLAVMLFAKMGVEVAIFEAGLGGRHDATSAIPACIQCYGPTGMDHAAVIGPGLAQIAADKAAAMRQGSFVFAAKQFPIAKEVLMCQAQRTLANLQFVETLPGDTPLGLQGKFQLDNAAVALATWRKLAAMLGIDSTKEDAGLADAFMAGRRQLIAFGVSRMLLDGAHNPHALRALLADLPFKPDLIIFSALADKDWRAGLAMLLRLRCPVLIPQLGNERAADAAAMASWANGIRPGSARPMENVQSALALLQQTKGSCLTCGSLYLLSEFFTIYPQYLQKDCA